MTLHRCSSVLSPSVFSASRRWVGSVFGVGLLAVGSASVSSCDASSNHSLGSTNNGSPSTLSDEYQVEVSLGGNDASVKVNIPSPAVKSDASVASPAVDSDASAPLRPVNHDASVERKLDGSVFLLESIEGHTLVDDSTVQLTFDNDRLTFIAGCNRHVATYFLCDGRLCVSGFTSTRAACSQERSDQDRWLADFFAARPNVTYEPPRLTFEGEGGKLEFLDREVTGPDEP